jgi:esterase/lipase superfamily enzyme
MGERVLYFATNRRHEGEDQWNPTGYGSDFSRSGLENLRFGKVTVNVDEAELRRLRDAKAGSALDAMFTATPMQITAFQESFGTAQTGPKPTLLGSTRAFAELQALMRQLTDVVVFIHGYNVSWKEAVGSGLALQEMANRTLPDVPKQNVAVILFSWPSDGSMLPYLAYKSDRADARASGPAVGRAFLKLRDFLFSLRDANGKPVDPDALCNQELHLLCHSMGNYVLQNALARLADHTPGSRMPRLFQNVFLCAPDVDDNALEPEQPLGRLHELARLVSVYYNECDAALHISDLTKGNPERLGSTGSARPAAVHSKVHQINCCDVALGAVQHGYFLNGAVNDDIVQSIADVGQSSVPTRRRKAHPTTANAWRLLDANSP